ncbi:hypothetical protein [Falsiroseomonas oryzae]|uniref:hypothetical protein n=1 Tax=Falsiroseomonas oryzae TaxID=2766473 RepID=UPI0022EA6D7C|nr:hypothetical protein [Roseomonas sp. MO-31]
MEAVDLAKQRSAFMPWDPRFQALDKAVGAAAAREAAAQAEAEAAARPEVPSEYPLWTVSLPSDVPMQDARAATDLMAGAARNLGLTKDEFVVAAEAYNSVARDAALGRPLNGEAELQKMRGMWGADFDRNLAIVRAEVKRLGPDVAAWLDETGLGNSSRLAHLILSAARRHGRAPW